MRGKPESQEQQNKVNKYISDFKEKSGGYNLGNVRYVENFVRKDPVNQPSLKSFFISMPVKNQESTIVEIIETLIKNTHFDFSLGILFDNCDDQSEEVFLDYIRNLNFGNISLVEVHVLSSTKDLFESTCENILSLFCRDEYFVSLQADCYLSDPTFLSRSLDAFNLLPNLLAISGRAVVPFHPIQVHQLYRDALCRNSFNFIRSPIKRKKFLGSHNLTYSYFGDFSEYPRNRMHFQAEDLRTLYIGESIIRGPIVWNFDLFTRLNGFNDLAYFLGRDDCDLSFRGHKMDYIVGYLPSHCFSVSENGTTRRPRTQEANRAIHERERLAESHPGQLSEFWQQTHQRGQRIRAVKLPKYNKNLGT